MLLLFIRFQWVGSYDDEYEIVSAEDFRQKEEVRLVFLAVELTRSNVKFMYFLGI